MFYYLLLHLFPRVQIVLLTDAGMVVMIAKLGHQKSTEILISELTQGILVAIEGKMIKVLRNISLKTIIFGLLLIFVAEACVSKAPPRRRNGKIPKSGRIPCPIKDC